MAEESKEKVKIELELPKSEVSIEPAGESAAAATRKARLKKRTEERKKKEEEKKKEEKEEDEKQVAGYKPADVAKAPLEPPNPKDKKGPNVHQKRVVIFGFALAAASLILWPLFSFWFFVAAACAGALVVAFGTFVRI